ncbi:MAG TPA: hypothetical protein VFX16_26520 [Pseudonocardiaceae bacterium]|nr:hypothetical protein [Pseudonocardiaceae bacterium]
MNDLRSAGLRSADPRSADLRSADPRSADLLSAAFGGRPDTVVAVPADATPTDRWLAGVVLGGQGRYAAAAGQLRRVLGGPDPVLAALAGATMASHLRQLGGHAAARRYDAEAARRLAASDRASDRSATPADPYGMDRTGALVDVLLGLAADAIGLHRPAEAARLHDAARRASGDTEPAWRVTVRIDWVATEIALATDRPAAAVRHAERATAVATAHGAVRHTVKSTMMLGAALTSGGTPDGRPRAERLLAGALDVSLTRGMFSLAWPCALLLADLAPDRAADFTETAANVLTSVFWSSDAEMRRIAAASRWMPGSLIRSGEPTRTSGQLTT